MESSSEPTTPVSFELHSHTEQEIAAAAARDTEPSAATTASESPAPITRRRSPPRRKASVSATEFIEHQGRTAAAARGRRPSISGQAIIDPPTSPAPTPDPPTSPAPTPARPDELAGPAAPGRSQQHRTPPLDQETYDLLVRLAALRTLRTGKPCTWGQEIGHLARERAASDHAVLGMIGGAK